MGNNDGYSSTISSQKILTLAVLFKEHSLIQQLLIDGTNVNTRTESSENNSILHIAVQNDDLVTVGMLIEKKANVNVTNTDNCTPLQLSARSNYLRSAILLVENGATIDFNTLKDAVYHGSLAVLQYLFSRIVILDKEILNTLLILSLHSKNNCTQVINRLKLIHFLLEKGANVNAVDKYGLTLLHHLAKDWNDLDSEEIIDFLVAKGADINAKDNEGLTPLHYASQRNLEICQGLIKHKANVNALSNMDVTPLHCSASHHHSEITQFLIMHGAHMEAKNQEGYTPLLCAAESAKNIEKSAEVIKILANFGVDINAQKSGCSAFHSTQDTALHLAVIKYNLYAFNRLITLNIDINTVNRDGKTPLMLAVSFLNKVVDLPHFHIMIDQLLKAKARIDIVDSEQSNVLHYAIRGANLKVMQVLAQPDEEELANGIKNRFFATELLATFPISKKILSKLIEIRSQKLRNNGLYAHYLLMNSNNRYRNSYSAISVIGEQEPTPKNLTQDVIILQKVIDGFKLFYKKGSQIECLVIEQNNASLFSALLPQINRQSSDHTLIENVVAGMLTQLEENKKFAEENRQSSKKIKAEIGRSLYFNLIPELQEEVQSYIFDSTPLFFSQHERNKATKIAHAYENLIEKSNNEFKALTL